MQSLNRNSCPLCRTPFQPVDVRKLHIDKNARHVASRPPSPSASDEQSSYARDFQRRITRIVREGAKTTEVRALLEEVREWLATQSPNEVKSSQCNLVSITNLLFGSDSIPICMQLTCYCSATLTCNTRLPKKRVLSLRSSGYATIFATSSGTNARVHRPNTLSLSSSVKKRKKRLSLSRRVCGISMMIWRNSGMSKCFFPRRLILQLILVIGE